MTSAAQRHARAVLCRYAAPGDPATLRIVDRAGPQEAARQVAAGRAEVWAEAEADLARLEQLGGRLVCPGDPEWPPRLDDLGEGSGRDDPGRPFALWVLGPVDLAAVTSRSVALVGSRAASPYGEQMAKLLAGGLVDRSFAVVSGGAYGIDAAAHQAALRAGGVTIAVLASGVDVPYPVRNSALLSRISAAGLVVSEAPVGARPYRHRFLSRNRLIAGLTSGTVIVEAGLRSGALNTARHARRLHRPLMGVPGPATNAQSAGVHGMLREHLGTRLVTSAAEVAEEAGAIGELADRPRAAEGIRDRLPRVMNQLLDLVPSRESVTADQLASAAGASPSAIANLLVELHDRGLVERTGTGYRLTELGRAPSATLLDA
jgi:DNA processing protein